MSADGFGRKVGWAALLAAVTLTVVAYLLPGAAMAEDGAATGRNGATGKLVVEYVEEGSSQAYKIEERDLATFPASGDTRRVVFSPFDNERGGGVCRRVQVSVDGMEVDAPDALGGSAEVPAGASRVMVRSVLSFAQEGEPTMLPMSEDVPPVLANGDESADGGESARDGGAASGVRRLMRRVQAASASPEVGSLVMSSHYQYQGIMVVNFYGSDHGVVYCAQRTNSNHPQDGETYNVVDTSDPRTGLDAYWQRVLDYVLANGLRDGNLSANIGGYTGEAARALTQAAVWSAMEGDLELFKSGTGRVTQLGASQWVALKAWLAEADAYARGTATTYDGCAVYGYSADGHQPVVIFGHLPPVKGQITLQKHDADNTGKSLEGAVYVISTVKGDASAAVGQFVTDAQGVGQLQNRSGDAMENAFEAGTYYVWEEEHPDGFLLDETVYDVVVIAGQTTAVNGAEGVSDHEDAGWAYVSKSSANTAITSGNACYELAGTTFGVYDAEGAEVATLEVQADGTTPKQKLASGTYWVHEKAAGRGYLVSVSGGERPEADAFVRLFDDDGWKKVEVKAGKTTEVDFSDEPAGVEVGLVATKVDATTGVALEGAEFTLSYYDNLEGDVSGKPKVSWVMRTDAEGKALLDADHLVSGDAFFELDGKVVLPIGTVTLQETKAPEGHVLEVAEGVQEQDGVQVLDGGEGAPIRVQVLGLGDDSIVASYVAPTVSDLGEPSIRTEATVGGSHVSPASADLKLVDTVSYENLVVGRTYVLKGSLHRVGPDGSDAGVLEDAQGKEVTVSTTFSPGESSGTVEVEFPGIDATQLAGGKLVVFEQLWQGDAMVASHEDASDEGQTVEIALELPVSGQTGGVALQAAACLAALALALGKAVRRRGMRA